MKQVAQAVSGWNCSGFCPMLLCMWDYLCTNSSVMWLFFQVEGFDKDGFPLKRISPTAITGQRPGKVRLPCSVMLR
jgi:hypothetical protein